MIVVINGVKKTLNAAPDISGLLETEGYADKLVAVARNGAFVPRGNYAATKLEDGDEIEVLAPMQGG